MKKTALFLVTLLTACGQSSNIYSPANHQTTAPSVQQGRLADTAVTQEAGTDLSQIPSGFQTVAETVTVSPTSMHYKTAQSSADGSSSSSNPQRQDNPSNLNFLAYRYNYGFVLPIKSVADTALSHAQICLDAGPSKCQILNSSTSAFHKDRVSANLSLRAEPNWLNNFKSEIQASIKDAKGKMTNNTVSAEDLTRQILDTGARLKAQKTLRDRLLSHLATRDAKLNDLLALERELARVQGQIESATSTLNVLQKRVSMSMVTISYQGETLAVSQRSVSPVVRAIKNFVNIFSQSLAAVISIMAGILPWLIFVILPGIWLFRKLWRRRQTRKAANPKSSPKPDKTPETTPIA